MQDVVLVHRLGAQQHLDEERPDRRLGQVPSALLVLQEPEQVAIARVLCHDVQHVVSDKSLVEGDHVLAGDRGEHADLVDGLGALLGRHPPRIHLLDRIDFTIGFTARLVDRAKCALAQELEQLKAIDLRGEHAWGRGAG